MAINKGFILSVTLLLLILVCFQGAYAYDPNWKQNQDEMFAEIGIKPGDVIDQQNCDKVKSYLPEGILNWIKKGEWTLKIGEFKYDFSPDKQWMEDSAKNAGKYKIDDGPIKYMVDASTGEIPKFVYGRPFPNVDVANDPEGSIKLMYNAEADPLRGGSMWNTACSGDWIGVDGFERSVGNIWLKHSFWQRPDGPQDNPKNYKFLEISACTRPYDTKGVASLYYRMADGSRDQIFMYLPMMRRVRRTSGANRSDPVLGCDTSQDDAGGWSGDNSSMAWKYLGEGIVLTPYIDWVTEKPGKCVKEPNGSWKSGVGEQAPISGWQVPNWQGVPWALVNAVWVPRKVYIIEATPLDPYYYYGRTDLYVDKKTMAVSVKTIYNKAMEYWKIVLVGMPAYDWAGKRSFCSVNFTLGVDDRAHHASNWITGGTHRGLPEIHRIYMDPRVERSLFLPAKLKMWTK